MDENEDSELGDMVSNMMTLEGDVMKELIQMKKDCPSRFISHWEMDEQDIEEATPEQIQNDPALRSLWAAENGHLDIVKELLQSDPSLLQVQDSDGYTMLHRASYGGHIHVVQYLLDAGFNVNLRTFDGLTALHSAAIWQEHEVVSLLLRSGADVNAQSQGGQTPLHLALTNPDNLAVIEELLMHPLLKPELTNGVGETVAQVARRLNMHYHLFEACDPCINHLKEEQADTMTSAVTFLSNSANQ